MTILFVFFDRIVFFYNIRGFFIVLGRNLLILSRSSLGIGGVNESGNILGVLRGCGGFFSRISRCADGDVFFVYV